MDPPESTSIPMRVRREPPRFRRLLVRRRENLSPRMVRVTLAGPEMEGLTVTEPAASVRLLLPLPGGKTLVLPSWNGNEFLLPDGSRPPIRTFTPRRVDPESLEIDIDVVIHRGGVASVWADAAEPGDPAAISGPGRGYRLDSETPSFVLLGDESAIPAASQLLEAIPTSARVEVHLEVAHPDARVALPDHPGAAVEWHDLPDGAESGTALMLAAFALDLAPESRLWAAGEASVVQRIRRHLFEQIGFPRARATVRGYWKHGRSGEEIDEQ